MFSKERNTNMHVTVQVRPSGQDTTKILVEDAVPMFCTRKYKYQSPTFLWIHHTEVKSKVVLPLTFCSEIQCPWGKSVISEFFLFFSFFLNTHAAFPSSFLLLIPVLSQSCSQAFLFRRNHAGVNRGFFSCRVHGDYWAPEEHLGPLDNLYVWAVEYFQFPEEKKEIHWKLLLLYCLL